eukprot:12140181-Karenia_brevis.AAC.1
MFDKQPDSDDAKMFHNMFGDPKKNGDFGKPDQQNLVFDSFLEQFPDGKAIKGKARGAGFNLSQFVH